ncbi:hypothetical protein TNCV_990271 [Trichonephila clavipes]|nr:hypothetical protein TNCV_990271 [Trichonephila clavipes]
MPIRRERWSVFVANRISAEIRKLTTRKIGSIFQTDQNPADILSRGCGPKQPETQVVARAARLVKKKIRRNSGRNQL